MGAAAAARAERVLTDAIAGRGQARVIAATGNSQLAFLRHLVRSTRVDWSRVELFHLDEYVGLAADHPASFRRVLREHLVDPTGIPTFHALNGEGDVDAVRRTVGAAIARAPIDVAFVGIGENTHLAFNDPPADFETAEPYLVVALDEACRRQQVGEGWFATIDDVPTRAISMSGRKILAAREILAIVPDERQRSRRHGRRTSASRAGRSPAPDRARSCSAASRRILRERPTPRTTLRRRRRVASASACVTGRH